MRHDDLVRLLTLMLGLGFLAAAQVSKAQEPQQRGLAPFGGKAQVIPGAVEFENFDEGPEGVAFHDIEAANDPAPTAHRKTAVDLEVTPDKKIILIGHMKEGEWMKYTVDVAKAGAYELELGVAASGDVPPEIRIEFDGVDVSEPIRRTDNPDAIERSGPTDVVDSGGRDRSLGNVSRGDKTPLELFLRAIAGWDTGLRRRMEDGKPFPE